MGIKTVVEGVSDPILTRMAEEDKVKWFRKPNLRTMYIYLFLCCMGVEITSGFDSTLIGVLQFSPPWNKCKISLISAGEIFSAFPLSLFFPSCPSQILSTVSGLTFICVDFSDGTLNKDGTPTLSAGLLGFVSSCYQLGSIIGVPIAPWLNQRFGRRWSVMGGSLIMIFGALLQGFAVNGKSHFLYSARVQLSAVRKLRA
jgi:MFS family permease